MIDVLAQKWMGPANGDGNNVPRNEPFWLPDGRFSLSVPAGQVYQLDACVWNFAFQPTSSLHVPDPAALSQRALIHTTATYFEGVKPFNVHLWNVNAELDSQEPGTTFWRLYKNQYPHVPVMGPAHVDTYVVNLTDESPFCSLWQLWTRIK